MKWNVRMHLSIALLALLAAFGLVACGKSAPKPPPKVEDTVFKDAVGAKERARVDTEKAMEVNKQKMDEAMKQQEAGQ